jgi:hypothetical protein
MGINTDREPGRRGCGGGWREQGVGGGGGERRKPSEGERTMRRIEQMDRGSGVFLPSPADFVPACQRAVACHIG